MARWNSDQIRYEVLELASSGKYKSAKKLAKDSGHASRTVNKILKESGIFLCKRGKFYEGRILELIKTGKYTNAEEIASILSISVMPVYRVLRKYNLCLPKKYARLIKKKQVFELHQKGYSINHICKALSMVAKDVQIVLDEVGVADIPKHTIKPFKCQLNANLNRDGRNNLPAKLSGFAKSSIIGSTLG